MSSSDPRARMWSDALEMIARAERMHRQMFEPRSALRQTQSWEPPVDVLETSDEVLILAALPGVDPDRIEATIEDGILKISGQRVPPPELKTAVIHR